MELVFVKRNSIKIPNLIILNWYQFVMTVIAKQITQLLGQTNVINQMEIADVKKTTPAGNVITAMMNFMDIQIATHVDA